MAGLNKFDGKARRQMRLQRKGVPVSLAVKYRERVVPADSQKMRNDRKRIDSENEDGSYWFQDRYYDDEGDNVAG